MLYFCYSGNKVMQIKGYQGSYISLILFLPVAHLCFQGMLFKFLLFFGNSG